MQYSFAKSCLLALASVSAVVAQTAGFEVMQQPTAGEVIPAGSTYPVTWAPSTAKGQTGPITITLLQGVDAATLQTTIVIGAAVDSTKGTYPWAIPTSLTESQTYGFKISLDSDPTIFQYSYPFKISGLSGTTGSATTSSTASAKGSITATHTSSVTTSTITKQVSQISTITMTSSNSSTHSSTFSSTTSSAVLAANTTTSLAVVPASTTVAVIPTASPTSNSTAPAVTQKPNSGARAAIGGTALLSIVMFFATMLL